MILSAIFLAIVQPISLQSFNPDPEGNVDRWLVVYNKDWLDRNGNGMGDSEEIARYWSRRRGGSTQNLIGLALPNTHTYQGQQGWEDFYDDMVVPLRNAVSQYPEDEILGFLFCHGVPYRIVPPDGVALGTPCGLDTTLMCLWTLGDRSTPHYIHMGHEDAYFDPDPGFGNDPGRFDPAVHRRQGKRTYLVARLDGLDWEHSIEQVEMAMYADAYLSPLPGFYSGTAYCDTRWGPYTWSTLNSGYPFGHSSFANTDLDFAYGRQWLTQAGFPLMWEPGPADVEIGHVSAQWEDGSPALLAPDALWYFGWYNYVQYHDVWEWKIGSAGSDLNSNSLAWFRNENTTSFLGQAMIRGLTCAVGVIAEPYLVGHPYPEVFLHYLVLAGYPFAEAARVSDQKSKWTNIYIGDPLYQPMRGGKVPLLDHTPPPPCKVLSVSESATAGEWTVATVLDPSGQLPDLGTLEVQWGLQPDYGSTAYGEDQRPRLFHQASIVGRGPDELIHYRADYTDPNGNVGLGEDLVFHTAMSTQTTLARVYGPMLPIPSGQAFEVEIVFAAAGGLSELSGCSVTVSSAVAGWLQVDISSKFMSTIAQRFQSADHTLIALRLPVNAILAPGDYTLEVQAHSSTGSDFDSYTLIVQ